MVARVKVIMTAAVTWLVAASAALTIASEEIAGLLPTERQEAAAAVIVKIVAWMGAAIAIIRRVEPVLPEDRGILPPQ